MYKIEAFHNMLYDRFGRFYRAGTYLTIDEFLSHYKGRAKFCKVYCPDKPYKWGIKEYLLVCALNYYTLKSYYYSKNFKIQEDKNPTKPVTHRLVLKLLEGIAMEGDHIFMDNYYTSYDLFADLHKQKIKVTGTVRINRLRLDKE
jgi:hypothetical protein